MVSIHRYLVQMIKYTWVFPQPETREELRAQVEKRVFVNVGKAFAFSALFDLIDWEYVYYLAYRAEVNYD